MLDIQSIMVSVTLSSDKFEHLPREFGRSLSLLFEQSSLKRSHWNWRNQTLKGNIFNSYVHKITKLNTTFFLLKANCPLIWSSSTREWSEILPKIQRIILFSLNRNNKRGGGGNIYQEQQDGCKDLGLNKNTYKR